MGCISLYQKEKDAFNKRQGSLLALVGLFAMNALCSAITETTRGFSFTTSPLVETFTFEFLFVNPT